MTQSPNNKILRPFVKKKVFRIQNDFFFGESLAQIPPYSPHKIKF